MGCIRLKVSDALWIYNNIPTGTLVEFYSSSNPGPLGKPTAQKISGNEECRNWDPTDPSDGNPWKEYLKKIEEQEKQKENNVTENVVTNTNTTSDNTVEKDTNNNILNNTVNQIVDNSITNTTNQTENNILTNEIINNAITNNTTKIENENNIINNVSETE